MQRYLLLCAVCFMMSCGLTSSSTSTETDSETSSDSGSTSSATTGLKFTAAGDFDSSAATSISAKTTTAQCSSLTAPIMSDDPALEDGLDCDTDGGTVTHVTPTIYKVAIKKAIVVGAGGSSDINFIEDTGTLANAEVVTFTTDSSTTDVITFDPADLTAGSYAGLEIEIYYVELTFPVAGTTRNVRMYLSDDNFSTEGNLGHHQGDITFIDDTGTELGWVDSNWNETLASSRGDGQNGAGGTDSETGHDRGFFGDTNLWNATAMQQGADQDIYTVSLDFDDTLEVPDLAAFTGLITVTLTFSIADTFYYEDFAPQNTVAFPGFYPASGGEASSGGAEWAPMTPSLDVSVSLF